jgi:tRNA U34 2-thiouridine synthase MnmA/TrmU
MNPCIDCHAMMFRLAGEVMQREGFDFLFSGEVLGQRPMSQNANALRSVENYSGFPGKILRPLCAKLLPVTPMEEAGLVDREQLLDIQGRSRKPQQRYARAWDFPDFPSSGGGCLLTEVGFSNRLRDQFRYKPDSTVTDVELLKVGRQFRLSERSKLVLGRNQADNDAMERLLGTSGLRLRCHNHTGPLGTLCGHPEDEDCVRAAGIVAAYGKGKDEPEVEVLFQAEDREFSLKVEPTSRADCLQWIVA